MRMYSYKMMSEEQIEAYRTKKREYMRRARADPIKNEHIKARTRKWYNESGRADRQKQYLENMRKNCFFKWRTRLFNMHYNVDFVVDDLQTIWFKQKGLCGLTGRKLTPDAHLDHILPIKCGGSNELDNLRWVCKQANFAKRNLTDEDFHSLCKDVVEFLGARIMERCFMDRNEGFRA